MKKSMIKRAISLLVAVMMLATIAPLTFADGNDNVIFPITVRQELGTSVPFASGVSKVDVTTHYTFSKGTTAKFADESGQYDALCFYAQNATVEEKDNVNFGISFGQDISELILEPSKTFLSFDYSPSAKPDVSQIFIGSMYSENGEWVKRNPISLSKYTALAASTWSHLEFSLADLGVTASDNAFEGIYFLYNNIAIPTSTGKLWDNVANAFNMAVVSSVGVNDKASVTEIQSETVNILTNSSLAVKGGASYPATTSTGDTVKSFGAWSKGVVAANNNAVVGDVGYYSVPSASAFTSALVGNIEDYTLEVKFTKGSSNTYLEDIQIGFGNANGTTGYNSLPTVVKTIPLLTIDPTFDYTQPNGTAYQFSVKVSDILEYGNETRFPGTGSNESKPINDLTGDNINLFAVKGTYRLASTATAQMIKFSEINLVAPTIALRNTTPTGGNISWAEPAAAPLCYTVFNSDGTKLCDTTDRTVANTTGGVYSVYAYYGNGNYSKELVIDTTAAPVAASISEDNGNLVFVFGDDAPEGAVAIIGEYSSENNTLENITIMPITEALGSPASISVEKPSSGNTVKAFIWSDLSTSIAPMVAVYPVEYVE